MRIGHVAAGIWRTVHLDMAKALVRLGHEVQVYTEDARGAGARRFSRLNEDGVEIRAIHHEKRNPWLWLPDRLLKPLLGRRFFTTGFALYRYLRQTRCDVYMVEGDGLGIFLALLRNVLRFRWVICVHDHEYLGVLLGYPGEPSSPSRERVKRWVLRRADGIRANSYVTRDALVRAGFSPQAITVIPLHWTARMRADADLAGFRTGARAKVLAYHGLPRDCALLLVMCRLTPFKGIDLSLRAFAHVLRERPAARLLICGGDRVVPGVGSYRALLERLAAELGVTQAVVFAGNVEPGEVKRYYAAADLHLVPSYIETFNYSAVEAALAGTRTVMTERIGSGYWLERCGAAIVVPGRRPEEFAAAVLRGLGQSSGIEEAQALMQRTAAELDVEVLASRVAEMLQLCTQAPA